MPKSTGLLYSAPEVSWENGLSGQLMADKALVSTKNLTAGMLASLGNAMFVIAAFVRVISPGSTFTSDFIISSILITMAIMLAISHCQSYAYANILSVFLLFFFGNFALHGLLMAHPDNNLAHIDHYTSWTSNSLNYGLITVFVALVALANGFTFSSGNALSNFVGRLKAGPVNQQTLRNMIALIAMLAALFFLMFARSLDFGTYVHQLGAIRTSDEFLGKGIYHIPMVILANMSTFLAMGLNPRKRFVFPALFLFALMLDFFSAARLNIAILVTGTLIIRDVMKPFRINILSALTCIIIVFLVGPVSLGLRGGYGGVDIRSWTDQIEYTVSYLATLDSAVVMAIIGHGNGIEAVTAITDRLGLNGDYQYGYFFLRSLVGWIPHALWPDRPLSGAMLMNEYFWPGTVADTGAPAITMIGEIYWDFGLIGLIGAFFLLGSAFKGLEQAKKRFSHNNIWVAVFYALFVWFWAIYSHEAFGGAFGNWLFYMVVWIGVYIVTTTIRVGRKNLTKSV